MDLFSRPSDREDDEFIKELVKAKLADDLEVRFVPNTSYFPPPLDNLSNDKGAMLQGKGAARIRKGKATIWVLGKQREGKVTADWKVLGHEVSHILNLKYPDQFPNPDEVKP